MNYESPAFDFFEIVVIRERCFSLIVLGTVERANARRDNALTRLDLFAYTPHCSSGG